MPQTRLSNYQLQRMQRTQNTNLPDVATVVRPTYEVNDMGGTVDEWETIYTDIPIYAEPRILREIKEDDTGGVIQSGVRWIARVSWEYQDIRLDDRVTVTEHRSGNTYTLEVTSLLSPQSYGTAFGFQCILVD